MRGVLLKDMCSAPNYRWTKCPAENVTCVTVGEVQCLNTADREVLTSVGEADSRNSVSPGGNRDTRAGTVGLTVEEHRIAAAAEP